MWLCDFKLKLVKMIKSLYCSIVFLLSTSEIICKILIWYSWTLVAITNTVFRCIGGYLANVIIWNTFVQCCILPSLTIESKNHVTFLISLAFMFA